MKMLFLGIISSLIISACNPDNCPDELVYELPFTIINPSDTISVGDTIWYESKFNKVLYDKNGNIENVFEDYDFSFISMVLTRIDSTEEQGGGLNLDIIPKVGSLTHTSVSFGYDYHHLNYKYYQNSRYDMRFAIVIKEPGLFTIQFGYINAKKKAQTNCTGHHIEWFFSLNEKDTNFDFLQSSKTPFWQMYKRSDWDRLASYCLYVKP